jgi:hypothetical protein
MNTQKPLELTLSLTPPPPDRRVPSVHRRQDCRHHGAHPARRRERFAALGGCECGRLPARQQGYRLGLALRGIGESSRGRVAARVASSCICPPRMQRAPLRAATGALPSHQPTRRRRPTRRPVKPPRLTAAGPPNRPAPAGALPLEDERGAERFRGVGAAARAGGPPHGRGDAAAPLGHAAPGGPGPRRGRDRAQSCAWAAVAVPFALGVVRGTALLRERGGARRPIRGLAAAAATAVPAPASVPQRRTSLRSLGASGDGSAGGDAGAGAGGGGGGGGKAGLVGASKSSWRLGDHGRQQ